MGTELKVSDCTRQNFLDAFWQIYENKNIEKIRVQEICDIAGYHRNSFYRYFTDVYDVLEQIEDEIINQIVINTDWRILMENEESTIERYLKVWEDYSRYLRVFADESKGYRFQGKLTRRLKMLHRELFLIKDADVMDDYIWEYMVTGSVAMMLYYFRRKPSGLSLKEILNLQMKFKDTSEYPLNVRQK